MCRLVWVELGDWESEDLELGDEEDFFKGCLFLGYIILRLFFVFLEGDLGYDVVLLSFFVLFEFKDVGGVFLEFV